MELGQLQLTSESLQVASRAGQTRTIDSTSVNVMQQHSNGLRRGNLTSSLRVEQLELEDEDEEEEEEEDDDDDDDDDDDEDDDDEDHYEDDENKNDDDEEKYEEEYELDEEGDEGQDMGGSEVELGGQVNVNCCWQKTNQSRKRHGAAATFKSKRFMVSQNNRSLIGQPVYGDNLKRIVQVASPEQQQQQLQSAYSNNAWQRTSSVLDTNSNGNAPRHTQPPDLVQLTSSRQPQTEQQLSYDERQLSLLDAGSQVAAPAQNQRRLYEQVQTAHIGQSQSQSQSHSQGVVESHLINGGAQARDNRCHSANLHTSIQPPFSVQQQELKDARKASASQPNMSGQCAAVAPVPADGPAAAVPGTGSQQEISHQHHQQVKCPQITSNSSSPNHLSSSVSSSSSSSSSSSASASSSSSSNSTAISSSFSFLSSSRCHSSVERVDSGFQSSSMFAASQTHNQNNEQPQQLHLQRQQLQPPRISTTTSNINFQAANNQQNSTSTTAQDHKILTSTSLTREQQEQKQQLHRQQPHQQPLQRTQYPPNHPLGNTKHLCSICGDRATGKHYGVYSCEGCKGFFKRTIRKDIVYVCRSDGNCLIDMRQRNRCQYCRYQKCLRQGMKREAVQEEKQRLKLRACAANVNICDSQVESTSNLMIGRNNSQFISNNIISNNSNSIHYQASTNFFHPSNNYRSSDQQHQTSQITDFVEGQLNVCDKLAQASNQNPPQHQHYDLHHNHHPSIDLSPPASVTPSVNYLNTYHHHLQPISNRLPVMRDYSSYYNATIEHSQADYHEPPRKYSRIDDLTLKWVAQMQIEQLLDWAKSVPKFTELLTDDQITLLKAYWNELIISEIAFKSIDVLKENQNSPNLQRCLCIGRGLFINESQASEIGLGNMFDRIINELVVKFHDMRVDSNELACLRAIILFNPETHGLKTSQPIEEYRSNVYTALEMYCRKTYEDQPNRFGRLLLRLPALRSIGLKCDSMRRCDSNNNNINLQHMNSDSSVMTNVNGNSVGNITGCTSPSSSSTATRLGYQVKLLFYDLCYEASSIDSFLRSNLMH